MDEAVAREIIDCLPRDRTLFRYFEDRYALLLLGWAVGEGAPISALRASRFGRLLARPPVKTLIAGKGDGMLRSDDLAMTWPQDVEAYVLTLDIWGSNVANEQSHYQTSRPGHNLVLQLNFSGRHDQAYRKIPIEEGFEPFVWHPHPVSTRGRFTLAWARMDIDMERGEALIEEIQTDWIRRVKSCLVEGRRMRGEGVPAPQMVPVAQGYVPLAQLETYAERGLRRHTLIWSEAMLSAAQWFLVEEIGIRRIWYHDFETGNRLKLIGQGKPPRSLYTDLPRRFCFEHTTEAPEFRVASAPGQLRHRLEAGLEHFWRLEV